jgi:hypothetical protein
MSFVNVCDSLVIVVSGGARPISLMAEKTMDDIRAECAAFIASGASATRGNVPVLAAGKFAEAWVQEGFELEDLQSLVNVDALDGGPHGQDRLRMTAFESIVRTLESGDLSATGAAILRTWVSGVSPYEVAKPKVRPLTPLTPDEAERAEKKKQDAFLARVAAAARSSKEDDVRSLSNSFRSIQDARPNDEGRGSVNGETNLLESMDLGGRSRKPNDARGAFVDPASKLSVYVQKGLVLGIMTSQWPVDYEIEKFELGNNPELFTRSGNASMRYQQPTIRKLIDAVLKASPKEKVFECYESIRSHIRALREDMSHRHGEVASACSVLLNWWERGEIAMGTPIYHTRYIQEYLRTLGNWGLPCTVHYELMLGLMGRRITSLAGGDNDNANAKAVVACETKITATNKRLQELEARVAKEKVKSPPSKEGTKGVTGEFGARKYPDGNLVFCHGCQKRAGHWKEECPDAKSE